MDWNEAIALLHGSDWKHAKIGLMRMRDLMQILGNPQKELKFIHIAGTNGKGSTCSMTRSILTKAGFKTGLYISPHLYNFNERISIDGVDISDSDLSRLALTVKKAVGKLNEEPTDFELIKAIAFLYFKEQCCDYVVLEVGMGGRLDATNIISASAVSCIMSIGLDHTEFLGDTEEKIAEEKAGIIKRGSDLVVLHQKQSVMDVIRKHFDRVNAENPNHPKLLVTDPESLHIISRSLSSQVFSYHGISDIRLNMLGEYQVRNAMAAIDIALLLRKHGVGISDEAIQRGISEARWPGRFELLSQDPVVIIDGAHNPDGVNALIGSIETFLPDTKINFVMGVMKDKDYHTMLRLISPYAESFTTELPYSARGLDPEVLKKEIGEYFEGPVQTASSVTDAVDKALARTRENGAPVICFGSLYQVADIRNYFLTDFQENLSSYDIS